MIALAVQRALQARAFHLPMEVWDTHVHCFDNPPPARIRGRTLALPHAPIATLTAMHEALGVNRAVMVEVGPLDATHDHFLHQIDAGGGRFAGVARLGRAATAADIDRLHDHGVRGCRFYWADFINEHTHEDDFHHVDALIAPRGWHLLLHVRGTDLIANEKLFRSAAAPIVIDHLAHLGPGQTVLDAAMELILDLQTTRQAYVKLSSTDRWSLRGPPDYADLLPLYGRVIDNDAGRVLWATDWPHVFYKDPSNPGDPPPDDADLLALLLNACRTQADVDAILHHTPSSLYQ